MSVGIYKCRWEFIKLMSMGIYKYQVGIYKCQWEFTNVSGNYKCRWGFINIGGDLRKCHHLMLFFSFHEF